MNREGSGRRGHRLDSRWLIRLLWVRIGVAQPQQVRVAVACLVMCCERVSIIRSNGTVHGELWWTYDVVVALVVCVVPAFGAGEARIQMSRQSHLTWTRLAAVWASDAELAVLVVLGELRLAGEDAFASLAPEVVFFKMLLQNDHVRCVKVAARLEAVLVLWL